MPGVTSQHWSNPLYDQMNGSDGFVSIEVSPKLAYDTQGTIQEVKRFYQALQRPTIPSGQIQTVNPEDSNKILMPRAIWHLTLRPNVSILASS